MRSAYHKFKMRRSSAHSEASGQAEDAEPVEESVAVNALSLSDSSLEPAVVEGGHSAVASPPAMLSPLSSTASTAVPVEEPVLLSPAIVSNSIEHIEHVECIEQPDINVALCAPSASDSTANQKLVESADVAAPTKPLGGTSVPAAAGDTAVDHSWSTIHADNFMVRHGPNYKKVSIHSPAETRVPCISSMHLTPLAMHVCSALAKSACALHLMILHRLARSHQSAPCTRWQAVTFTALPVPKWISWQTGSSCQHLHMLHRCLM
jgi:hypothetical protein